MKYIFLLFLSMFIGCSSPYTGDGVLSDRGFTLSDERYRVTLGKFPFSQGTTASFVASGLPNRRFILGVELSNKNCQVMDSAAEINFVVYDEHHQVVVKEKHAFYQLVWDKKLNQKCDRPFGYVKAAAKEISIGNGNVCMRPIYSGADYGTGSSFISRNNGIYHIVISIESPPSTTPIQAGNIVLKDGGVPTKGDGGC